MSQCFIPQINPEDQINASSSSQIENLENEFHNQEKKMAKKSTHSSLYDEQSMMNLSSHYSNDIFDQSKSTSKKIQNKKQTNIQWTIHFLQNQVTKIRELQQTVNQDREKLTFSYQESLKYILAYVNDMQKQMNQNLKKLKDQYIACHQQDKNKNYQNSNEQGLFGLENISRIYTENIYIKRAMQDMSDKVQRLDEKIQKQMQEKSLKIAKLKQKSQQQQQNNQNNIHQLSNSKQHQLGTNQYNLVYQLGRIINQNELKSFEEAVFSDFMNISNISIHFSGKNSNNSISVSLQALKRSLRRTNSIEEVVHLLQHKSLENSSIRINSHTLPISASSNAQPQRSSEQQINSITQYNVDEHSDFLNALLGSRESQSTSHTSESFFSQQNREAQEEYPYLQKTRL